MITLNDFACGLLAGWSQIIIGQPFDYLKTMFQVSTVKYSNNLIKQYTKEIYKNYGLKGFYRGSSSLFFGFGLTIATEFAVFEACKKYFMRTRYQGKYGTPQQLLNMKEIMLSGGIVGFTVSFIYCPVQYAKIIRQMNKDVKTGSFMLLFNEIAKGNIKRIFQGFVPSLFREIGGSMIYYSTYQGCVRQLCKLMDKPRNTAGIKQYFFSGAMAGLGYWTLTYPVDVIKTRRQYGESYSQILQNKFIKQAFNGYRIVAVRSFLVNGFSFVTFEYMKALFGYIELLTKY